MHEDDFFKYQGMRVDEYVRIKIAEFTSQVKDVVNAPSRDLKKIVSKLEKAELRIEKLEAKNRLLELEIQRLKRNENPFGNIFR